MADNPYDILGVKKADSFEKIHTAYRKKAKQYHPDLNGGNYQEYFKKINLAYETLSDSKERRKFDREQEDLEKAAEEARVEAERAKEDEARRAAKQARDKAEKARQAEEVARARAAKAKEEEARRNEEFAELARAKAEEIRRAEEIRKFNWFYREKLGEPEIGPISTSQLLSLYKNKKVNKNTHIFNRTECIWTNYSSCSDKVIRDSLWSGQKEILTFFAVIGILAFILSGKSTTAVTAPPVPPVTAHNMVALSPVLYDSAASTSDSSDYLSCSDKQIIKAMPKIFN